MKTPLTYYGGKQQLTKTILALIPAHTVYCEPFIGGAAIFFAKEPSKAEIINDTNGEIVNFYEVVREDFSALQKEVSKSLRSKIQHRHAEVIYANPDMFDRVKRAWAVWMLANTSFGSKLDGAFSYDRGSKFCRALDRKKRSFIEEIAIRLHNTQIECGDALKTIQRMDTEETFFYADPPYVGADQGHYDGYSQEDFNNLLELLSNIKGKFLLSSYRNSALSSCSKRHSWETIEIRMASTMTQRRGKSPRQKVEVLTANYPILERMGQI